ncbi:hypothetical protein DACRYDRAFT_115072 [Dacryopinax primogenitus]|uniref:Uncharacterized protein n=1 Tax=Dacryopinax primogenitus (strain DJM 731) TaxID=1858805 RepID=M5G697_DACPD|nr:uncharacterized protein DACRYDRAFT_115072 [Dacryopinax primogenitus]EJU03725.1 hypothetical protein DACRYDRAFT_115072 [Dacryopinax primogenitus]
MDHMHKYRHTHVAMRQVIPPPIIPPPTSTKATTTSTTTSHSTSSSSSSTTTSTTTTSTSTSSTPVTFATTPPNSQSLAPNTSPAGVATYAGNGNNSPPKGAATSNYMPIFSTGATVRPGSIAGAQATGAAGKSSTTSGSMSTTTIIGIAAGGLVGAIIVGAIIAYIIRQCRRRTRAEATFDRNSFIRNSVLLDDKNESTTSLAMDEKLRGSAGLLAPQPMQQSNSKLAPLGVGIAGGPRPPSMIQRHYDAPALQPGQYAQYPAQPPSAYYPPGGMPLRSPFANSPGGDLPSSPADSFFTQAQLQSQGGKYYPGQYRQNNIPGTPVSPPDLGRTPTYNNQGTDHADLAREPSIGTPRSGRGLSVTPFQAQQYAEISRLVNTPVASSPPMPPNKDHGDYDLPARSVASPPPAMGRPMDMSPSGFRSPSPPSPMAPPRNLVSPFQRIDSMPPMLPPLLSSHTSDASLSGFSSDRSLNMQGRSGTPTDPNPQQYFTATRTTSPQQLQDVRSNSGYPALVEPNHSPRTPQFHSGVSTASHFGEAGNFNSAGSLNSLAQSHSGNNLSVPGAEPTRRLSVRNSVASDARYSMYGEDDVYGGI